MDTDVAPGPGVAPDEDARSVVSTSRLGLTIAGGGALLLAIVLVVALRGGFNADPYDTVLDAAEATLGLPIAADATIDVDLSEVANLAGTGGLGAALGIGLLRGELRLTGHLAVDADTSLVALRSADGDVGGVRLDRGEVPMVRLDPDALPSLPFMGFARAAAPGLFGGAWVELRAASGIFPDAQWLSEAIVEWRDEVAALDRDRVREEVLITHVGREADGERFRVAPVDPDADDPADGTGGAGGSQARDANDDGDDEVATGPGFDVWVADGRISRLRIDLVSRWSTELFGLAIRGREGMLVVDLRHAEPDVPERPTPSSVFDLDRIMSSLGGIRLPFDLDRFLPFG